MRVVSVVEEIASNEKGRGRDEKELLGLLQVSVFSVMLSRVQPMRSPVADDCCATLRKIDSITLRTSADIQT